MNLYEHIKNRHRFEGIKNNFEDACKQNGCTFGKLAKDIKGNEIFYCQTPKCDGKRIAITSGLHGDEPAGPYGILDYFANNKFKNVNLLIIPVFNPDGFIKDRRKDATNRDLNRQWNKNDKTVVVNTKDLIEDFNPEFLISLHEDATVDGFYFYPSKGVHEDIIDWIHRFLYSKMDPVMKSQVHGDKVNDGIITQMKNLPKNYASMETYFSNAGIPNVTLEIPSVLDLNSRIQTYSDLLKNFINYYKSI